MKTMIQEKLFSLQDEPYRALTVRLNPSVDPDSIIGVRLPAARTLAKELIRCNEAEEFLSSLPHEYFDEDMLHALMLCEEKDFRRALDRTETFLPYANSWSLTDTISPKAFKKYPKQLLSAIEKWLYIERPYTVRFGVLCLMRYFLDDLFDEAYPKAVASVKSEEYYVNMMRAWYFATALAKQYDSAVVYLEKNKLDTWTHNKTIQKAVESYRITQEQKEYLRTLRRKAK